MHRNDIHMGRPFLLGALSCATLVLSTSGVCAQLYINEIYFDPPGGLDSEDEYIELRGEPGIPLVNHYLIFLESEDNMEPGGIDNIFDLGAYSLGSNGFLALRQKGSAYTVNELAADYVNDGDDLPPFGTSPGFGNGADSTIGASDDGGEGQTENGAFSALLILNDSGVAPALLDDLDADNDGQLDVATGKAGWTILDSVGQAEPGENNAKFYAAVNFNHSSNTGATASGDGIIVTLPYEIEYLGRWGNSVGHAAADWHVSNLTDDNGSGFQDRPDYRQAGNPHPMSDNDITTPAPQTEVVETNQNMPYGTQLTNTLGAPNFITGDFNKDGVVDAADYTVWRDTQGQTGTELDHPAADPNHDFVVDGDDYDLWAANFGLPVGGTPTATPGGSGSGLNLTAVPEPSAWLLVIGLLLVVATSRCVVFRYS